MKKLCGIYGYHITQPLEFPRFVILPRTTDHNTAQKWSRDPLSYNLTAVLEIRETSLNELFYLETVLSFIEHFDVLITPPIEGTGSDLFSNFAESMTTHPRMNGGGEVIGNDVFFPESRYTLISLILGKLQDKDFCERTQFNIMFFKYIETFRSKKVFVEITYFLLYSGLETYSRSVRQDFTSSNSSAPISELLKSYGFNVEIENSNDLKRAVSSYTHLRNAIFHNSALSVFKNINGNNIEYKIGDYLYNISQLVVLVILKAVSFDDGHINWESWIDHQPFK